MRRVSLPFVLWSGLILAVAPASAQTTYPAFNVGNNHPNTSGQVNVASPYTLSSGATVTVTGATTVSDTLLPDGASFSITSGTWNTNTLYDGHGGRGAISVDGSGSTLAVTSSAFDVGYLNNGSLAVTNGAHVTGSGALYAGYNTNVTGTLSVSGTGSSLALTGALTAGYLGTGNVTVSNGGQATMNGATLGSAASGSGTITVSGGTVGFGTSSSLYIGNTGPGSLSVDSAGVVTAGNTYLGYNRNATGTLSVSGTGSSLAITGALTAGYQGTGTMTVSNGGQVTMSSGATLGGTSTGSGTITVSGGTVGFGTSSSLFIGSAGPGRLNVDSAGVVTAGHTYLGYGAGTTGTIALSGANSSFTNNAYFYVGYSGNGVLNVQSGAKAIETGYNYLYVGYNSGSTGTITVDGAGSSVSSGQYIYVGYGGTGTLNIQNGGSVSTSTLSLSRSGGSGTINITGTGSILNVSTGIGWAFGDYGAATVNVTNGGRIAATGGTGVNGAGVLNVNTGGSLSGRLGLNGGTANIGSGSTVSGVDFYRGNPTESTLNILSGGSVGGSFNFMSVLGATNNNRINVYSGGSITSALSLQNTILRGGGTLSSLTVGSGSRVQPGDIVGTMRVTGATTLSGGSAFTFQFHDANDGAGVGWDLMSIGGKLTINGRSTSRISLSFATVNADGSAGWMADFDPSRSYSWSLFSGASSLAYGSGGSLLNSFSLDLSGFQNPYGGTFALAQTGSTISLHYTGVPSPIPEPSSVALLAGSAALLTAGWIRRGRGSAKAG